MNKNIIATITKLNKKLIHEDEISDLNEETENLEDFIKEINNLIQKINIQSIASINSNLIRIRIGLIDYQSYLLTLEKIAKNILKKIYDVSPTSSAEKILFPILKIEKNNSIILTLEKTITIIEDIYKKHTIFIKNENDIKDLKKTIEQLHLLSAKIKFLTKKIDKNDTEQITTYIKIIEDIANKIIITCKNIIALIDEILKYFN